MRAWLLDGIHDLNTSDTPLKREDIPVPEPRANEVRVKVTCCGICHTELDEIEGRTAPPRYPVVPGHQVVGVVDKCGANVSMLKTGERVGIAWIFSACGECEACLAGDENLCSDFIATGRDANGGYAEYMVVDEYFAYPIPDNLSDTDTAPLLCAGAVGYRSLRLANLRDGQVLGLTGFGGSGHLVLKMAKYLYPHSDIMVFARHKEEQNFAMSIGATWTGTSSDAPPEKCHAIIDTTPAWKPVTDAMLFIRPGGRLVINAIRKESGDQDELLKLSYHDQLWMEREIKSVANVTRKDVKDFLELASKIPIHPETELYTFDKANAALTDLKRKHIKGAKVLKVS